MPSPAETYEGRIEGAFDDPVALAVIGQEIHGDESLSVEDRAFLLGRCAQYRIDSEQWAQT